MDINSNTGISKSELIATLSDIDIKINSLHKRSTSDFMQLNEHLKDYHKKTRTISENAFRIFETISGGKDMDLIKELKSIQNRIESYRSNINSENLDKLKLLKEISLKSNRLNIHLKNLRQDFTTLKFLSTNYSLISHYNDSHASTENNHETWNSEITAIHNSIIALNEQVDTFRDMISVVISDLNIRTEKAYELFRDLSNETDRNIDSVTLKNHESKLHFPVLKEKTMEASRSISDIITHLQYHDIIRQKIEHIQKSHYRIIDDLTLAGGMSGDDCSAEDYIKVGDIIDLQAAQLLLVSKEYQNALNVITRNFQGIARDMTVVSEISDRFSFESSNAENTLLHNIREQLDKGIIQLDQNNNGIINPDYRITLRKLEEIFARIEKDIRPGMASFAGENSIVNKFRYNEAGSGVYSQMIALNRDIEIKSVSISESIIELKNLTKDFNTENNSESEVNCFEIDRLQLMVRITRILDTLDRDNAELDKVLKQNRELNNNILQKIESAVNKSDYCEYFESIVGEVILQLSGINNSIRPSNQSQRSNKSENLRDIKTGYTMESERLIHDMVVTGKDEKDSAEQVSTDNEIEFF